jgi:hypothetical protein
MHTELIGDPADRPGPLTRLLTQLTDHPNRTFPQLRRVLPRWCHSSSPFQASEPPTNPGRSKNGKAPHLVAALVHGIGAVLGQVAVAAKSNEIPAVRNLLAAFTDLAGAVVTIDAMHT